jgi:hypothetical protein
MELGHGRVIHAIEMVSCQDQDILRAGGLDFEQLLADRICGALVPGGALGSLFRRPDLHPTGVKHVEVISQGNVPVERDRIELGQDRHPINPRIDAVADRDVNEAILSCNWHSRFRTHLGQRV